MYKTIISQLLSYGCETWSHTLRKEYKLKMFQRAQKGIWT